MLVKCRICENKIDRQTAYKVTNKNANECYCSKTEYETTALKKKKETAIKNRIYDEICSIFGYKVINSALFKELTSIHKAHIYEDMLYYLTVEKEYISKAMSKEFTCEYAKIRYFFAIFRNRIADCLNERDKNMIVKECSQIAEYRYSPKKKRKHDLKEKEDNYTE